ncbi:zinc metalloprotease [Streptacidiphilus fuscans]|uniref:Peptide zinc metalloprotease protein n=1 Tax=Streptacidiphilus fuscans TaxID=2789292 RepID=A0A931B1E5_9ACTN|nr:hypothetical protein [Streptacidiphilus fuscans]MBF9069400.1 hypothetical protein [Streptacidiphilus fuscans]
MGKHAAHSSRPVRSVGTSTSPTPAPTLPGPRGRGEARRPEPDDGAPGGWIPRTTVGLEVHGRFHGSGTTESVYTVRRADGQVVELSQLLHHVVCAVDGLRTSDQIAARVSATFGRELCAENVEFLIREKLGPLGVAVCPGDLDEVPGDAPSADLLLGLKGRATLVRPSLVRRLTSPLLLLHHPVVVTLVLAAFASADAWFFVVHGAARTLEAAVGSPGELLALFSLTVASLLFHELGHASACRYGGARPGRIGFGVYLLWPSFFTDVTDVYRRPRADRLRTDLGGVYFNIVFMLALFGGYAGTGSGVLLAAVYLGHFEVLQQLVPIVRLDGYYILSDLAGVPDLFGQVGPVLRGVLRRGPAPGARLAARSRRLVTVWVLVSTSLLVFQIGYTLIALPQVTAQSVSAMDGQLRLAVAAVTAGHAIAATADFVRFAFLLLPLGASFYLLLRLAGALRSRLFGRLLRRP